MPRNFQRNLLIPVLFFFILTSVTLASPVSVPVHTKEAEVYSTQDLKPYNGVQIRKISIEGLSRTSTKAVRYLLGCEEGDLFDTEKWIYGLKKFYNTSVLYNIHTKIIRSETNKDVIDITVFITDKWTLVPFVAVQGGGGSSLWGGGIYDNNFGGYFTSVSLGAQSFNGLPAYDINLFQEWFLNTNLMFGADFSRNGISVSTQDTVGNFIQNFNWFRNQQQILFGSRIGENIRLFSYLEFFQDSILNKDANTRTDIYPDFQYRLRPTFILGRSNLTNYLEEGYEIRIALSTANFLSGDRSYHQFSGSFKHTWIALSNVNFAYTLSAGIMTLAPLPYQFRLGGFDTIRGFGTNRVIGHIYLNGSFEFRPTLWAHRFSWAPLDLFVIQGCLFSDAGWMQSTTDPTGLTQPSVSGLGLLSVGAGIRFIFAKYSNAILRVDFAQTIRPNEGYGLSFSIGQSF